MTVESHRQMANFIWDICNLLRGPYKRNEYRKVILPLTVLRRFDCLLAPTKEEVLKKHAQIKGKPESVVRSLIEKVTGYPFYNLNKLNFGKLLDDSNQLAANLNKYINAFSPNVREIMERFAFGEQIARMNEKNLLYEVIKAFSRVDLSLQRADEMQMGYVFEELIRIGAEQANEEAGEHFTPREVIRLMVNLLLSPENDLRRSHVVKTIYDPACGTGGMLSVADNYIRSLNRKATPMLFGQDWNDEAWAVCKSDMLIKKEDADQIRLGDTFSKDAFDRDSDGRKHTFDYMLANPPFGVEWKQQQKFIENEAETYGYEGRFGAGLPRINDGSLLFLQHMISKMRPVKKGGSRIGIVFNGSPLFTGDAGSGESNIRQWIIENDWLEAVVALPDQLFYNTGISTYIWILTNRKEERRKGKIQLIDARQFFIKMKKSLGNKRNKIGDPADEPREPDQIGEITRIHGNFQHGETRTQFVPSTQPLPTESSLSTRSTESTRSTVSAQSTESAQPIASTASSTQSAQSSVSTQSTKSTWSTPSIVSKVFDNADFGFHKITVERPLRLNFQASAERIARLELESAFRTLASSQKKNENARKEEIEEGKRRQEAIRSLLGEFGKASAERVYKDRAVFLRELKALDVEGDEDDPIRLSASELKAIQNALGERDETAEICYDKHGEKEPDPDLRDTESVPLKENIEDYFKREVLPHVPDAWIDHSKTKVGYEIPLNRHFYVYEPPRPLEEIEAEIKTLESDIVRMLGEVTA